MGHLRLTSIDRRLDSPLDYLRFQRVHATAAGYSAPLVMSSFGICAGAFGDRRSRSGRNLLRAMRHLKRDPDPAGLRGAPQTCRRRPLAPSIDSQLFQFEEFRLGRRVEADARGSRWVSGLHPEAGYRFQSDLPSREIQEHVRRAARENLHEGDVAVNIGANIGVPRFLPRRWWAARGA